MFKTRIKSIAFLMALLMLFSVFAIACDSKLDNEKTDTKTDEKETNKKPSQKETEKKEESSSESESQIESEENNGMGSEESNDPQPDGAESEESELDDIDPEDTEPTVEELDDSMFNIFGNQKYLCCFVWSKNPTDAERGVASELKTLMSKKTGKQIVFVTPDKVSEDHKYVILLGNTGEDESKDVSKRLGEREAVIDIIDNKLVIAFNSKSSGVGVVRKMMSKLTNKQTMRLAFSYTANYKAFPEIEELPEYKGGTAQIIDCGQDTIMKLIKGSNAQTLDEYAQSLDAAGFGKISERTAEGNTFYTYKTDSNYIYMYYTKYSGQIRVITGPIESLCEEDYSIKSSKKVSPYLASVPNSVDSQGYIFRLEDGRFIVQDGGVTGEDRVYAALKKLEPQKDIVIAAWFISHPHPDHYPALMDFAKAHGSDKTVTVERIIHNYAHEDIYVVKDGTADDEYCDDDVRDFYKNLRIYMQGVPIIKAHTGQIVKFGSTSIEVIYTIEDLLPEKVDNINATSFVFRATVGGQSIMVLADTYVASANVMCSMWGNYLKSDVVQVAHHAIWPATAELYNKIQGKLVLITSTKSGYRVSLDDTRWKNVTDAYLKYATDISISLDGMVILDLPYVFKNNKNQVLQEIRGS